MLNYFQQTISNISKRDADKRHLTDLDYPTDLNVKKSYIKNRPMLCKRNDIGSKELIDMSFNLNDMDKVINVSKQIPTKSRSFRKHKKSNQWTHKESTHIGCM